MVVVRTPALNFAARILETGEPVQVQTVLSEFAVEALNERVVGWFAGLDEVQLHTGAS